MPSKSPAQHRLMQAAAHTTGGYGGVPQSVGREFVAADKARGSKPMAKLSTKARNRLPTSEFAGPGRSYPINDASHARNAKARASEMEHKGRISKSTEAKIDAKANRNLGKSADRRDPNHRHPRSHAEFEALGRDD